MFPDSLICKNPKQSLTFYNYLVVKAVTVKQRGISVVLEGEGGAGDLKGDIQKSGLYGCEEDESIPYLVFTFI